MAEKSPDGGLKVQTKSKRKASVFGLNYHLPSDALEVLKRLGNQEPQCNIANQPQNGKTVKN